jgi:hypothetical protein
MLQSDPRDIHEKEFPMKVKFNPLNILLICVGMVIANMLCLESAVDQRWIDGDSRRQFAVIMFCFYGAIGFVCVRTLRRGASEAAAEHKSLLKFLGLATDWQLQQQFVTHLVTTALDNPRAYAGLVRDMSPGMAKKLEDDIVDAMATEESRFSRGTMTYGLDRQWDAQIRHGAKMDRLRALLNVIYVAQAASRRDTAERSRQAV